MILTVDLHESGLVKFLPGVINESKDNEQILSLFSTVPQSTLDPSFERFQMYKNALQVYNTVRGNERLPVELKKALDANKRLKQRTYHLVFGVLHRKYYYPASL